MFYSQSEALSLHDTYLILIGLITVFKSKILDFVSLIVYYLGL